MAALRRKIQNGVLLLLIVGLSACAQGRPFALGETPTATPTMTAQAVLMLASVTPSATAPPPSRTPEPPAPTLTPTRSPTPAPTATAVRSVYHVKQGDTLLSIALNHDITLEELIDSNQLHDTEWLPIGAPLYVPSSITVQLPSAEPLAPDSEVVYSNAYVGFNTSEWIARRGGYLAEYEEWGRSGAQIIEEVAAKYHVGPRVLLATMEMLSGWVSGEPHSLHPFGIKDSGPPNLGWQAAFAAKKLMEGYYGQLEGRRDWVVLDNGVVARLAPGTTPGGAAVANLLASVTPASTFPELLRSGQFQATYHRLFGEMGGGPILPPDGMQPYFSLPFPEGELWYFTGGPHGGYVDQYSGWAALDFAPPVASGCWQSRYAVHAVAPGLVIGSEEGETWIDMDGDGDIRTGWVLFYMHLGTRGRVERGQRVEAGEIVGYPSCEGGISSGAHLHLARMYNGQWMPASGKVPFQMGEWQAEAVVGSSYDGSLVNQSNGRVMTACDCRSARKNRFPEHRRYSGP